MPKTVVYVKIPAKLQTFPSASTLEKDDYMKLSEEQLLRAPNMVLQICSANTLPGYIPVDVTAV